MVILVLKYDSNYDKRLKKKMIEDTWIKAAIWHEESTEIEELLGEELQRTDRGRESAKRGTKGCVKEDGQKRDRKNRQHDQQEDEAKLGDKREDVQEEAADKGAESQHQKPIEAQQDYENVGGIIKDKPVEDRFDKDPDPGREGHGWRTKELIYSRDTVSI